MIAGNYPHDSIYMLQHLFNNWFLKLDMQKMTAAAVMLAFILGADPDRKPEDRGEMEDKHVRKKKTAVRIGVTLFVLILIFPILLLSAGSLMGPAELKESYGSVLYGSGGKLQWKLFPLYPTLKAYLQLLLDSPDFFVMFWNSCRQTFTVLAGQLCVGLPAAWALGRYRFKGRKLVLYLYMILMILPFQVTMVSGYTVLSFLKILDTHWAVILPGIFPLSGVSDDEVFQQIPDSLLEAAKWTVRHMGSIFRIGLPLGMPGVRLFADPEFHGMLECDRGADDIFEDEKSASGLIVFVQYYGK